MLLVRSSYTIDGPCTYWFHRLRGLVHDDQAKVFVRKYCVRAGNA